MDRYTTIAEVVTDSVQVNDNIKAQDGQWYTVTVVNHHIGMCVAKRDADDGTERTITPFLIKN